MRKKKVKSEKKRKGLLFIQEEAIVYPTEHDRDKKIKNETKFEVPQGCIKLIKIVFYTHTNTIYI